MPKLELQGRHVKVSYDFGYQWLLQTFDRDLCGRLNHLIT